MVIQYSYFVTNIPGLHRLCVCLPQQPATGRSRDRSYPRQRLDVPRSRGCGSERRAQSDADNPSSVPAKESLQPSLQDGPADRRPAGVFAVGPQRRAHTRRHHGAGVWSLLYRRYDGTITFF